MLLSYPSQCLLQLALLKLATAFWLQRVVLRLPRYSAAAALAAAPMFCWNAAVPFFLWDGARCPAATMAHGVSVLGWAANFKVLAYLSGRGPNYNRSRGLLEVLAAIALPASLALPTHEHASAMRADGSGAGGNPAAARSVHPRLLVTEGQQPASAAVWPALRAAALYSCALAAAVAAILLSTVLGLPLWAVQALYGLAFLSFVPTPLALYGALASLLSGRPAQPATWRPWAARSVSEFWGARWNRYVAEVLRWVVYEPIATGFWRLYPGADAHTMLRAAPAWRRILAVLATFLVSGVAHDLIWVAITGRWLWLFTPFFLANALVVVAEGLLRQQRAQRSAASGATASTRFKLVAEGLLRQQRAKRSASSGATASTSLVAPPPRPQWLALALRAAQSAAVFGMILGLGGLLVWPRLAPALGELYLGAPGVDFGQLHMLLTGARS